jgi:hypothetical protein
MCEFFCKQLNIILRKEIQKKIDELQQFPGEKVKNVEISIINNFAMSKKTRCLFYISSKGEQREYQIMLSSSTLCGLSTTI